MNKKRFFALGILIVLVIALNACTFDFTRSPSGDIATSWTTSGLTHNHEANRWHISANRVNGYTRRDINFTAESLSALQIATSNNGGNISLAITQGETNKLVELAGEVNETLDISNDFEPGNIRLRLEFEDAENVVITLNW